LSEENNDSEAGRYIDLPAVVVALVTRHGRKWRSYVARVVRCPAEAEDVVQEAVRRVLEADRRFHSQEEARMYLARAISNTAIEYYKARNRGLRRHLPLREHVIACGNGDNPHDRLEQREQQARCERLLLSVRDGLRLLPEKQYEALRMTLLDPAGLSIREAGVDNDIPYSTLRHRSLGGIRRLRKYLRRTARLEELRFVAV